MRTRTQFTSRGQEVFNKTAAFVRDRRTIWSAACGLTGLCGALIAHEVIRTVFIGICVVMTYLMLYSEVHKPTRTRFDMIVYYATCVVGVLAALVMFLLQIFASIALSA
jgi:uncharacterized protein (UPF0261 family)